MGRQIKPVGPFGHFLYQLMRERSRADGGRWTPEDLALALTRRGSAITAKQVREWIGRGGRPGMERLQALSEEFERPLADFVSALRQPTPSRNYVASKLIDTANQLDTLASQLRSYADEIMGRDEVEALRQDLRAAAEAFPPQQRKVRKRRPG